MKACSIVAQLGLVCVALAAPAPNDLENRQFDGIPTDLLGPILSGLPEIPGFSIPTGVPTDVPTGLPSLPVPTGLAEGLEDPSVLAQAAEAPDQPDPADLPTDIPALPTPPAVPETPAIPEIPEIPEIPGNPSL